MKMVVRLRYKIYDKEKSISIGVYPKIGLKQTRENAQLEREKLDKHLDPSEAISANSLDRHLMLLPQIKFAQRISSLMFGHLKAASTLR